MATTSSSVAAAGNGLPASIGRFVPTGVLGRGGQGVVYIANDPDLGREVAVKCLSHRTRDPEKLLNEARNVARLDHPGIVALFEAEAAHEPPYLVYQFAPGSPLKTLCDTRDPLPVNRVARIMVKLLDAVHYAHGQGILHRDLTPANILLDDKDNPRILDFGISVALNDSTGETAVNGTVNYLAPEVLNEKPPSTASDLFALAVVMHEMLTGKPLFRADNPMAVIYKILNERILPPSMSRDGIDAALEAIVMKGLEKDPAQRYENAGVMRDAITAYLEPASEKDEQAVDDGNGSAITFLQRRMSRKPDFPAVSEHIGEINQKSGLRDSSDANELASVILKDYALTTKLLKVVNSAVYGQYGGTISTISRAVVILGFEQVRAIALGIIIFEHLKNGEQADRLKDAACSSFLSGMLAREICPQDKHDLSEEAFIGAMFHRLGRHLAIYYFPEEFVETLTLMESRGCDEATAAREIFGATLHDFGIAIARDWNLPERLVQAMQPRPAGKLKPSAAPDARVAQLSAFSNEVAELLGGDHDNLGSNLETLLERYEDSVALEAEALKSALADAVEATREYAKLISIDLESSPFLGQVRNALEPTAADAHDTASPASNASTLETGSTSGDGDKAAPRTETQGHNAAVEEDHDPAQRQIFLTNAISELTTAIIEKSPINDMFTMVLEAFYRSFNFSHVLFMMRDPKQRAYKTRFGFGTAIDERKADFSYKVSDTDDIFHQAVRKGRNAVIIDASNERYAGQIPPWCLEATQPQSILLFSIVVNKVCIGLIYADTCDGQLAISAQELKLLNTLVKQLTLGVNQR